MGLDRVSSWSGGHETPSHRQRLSLAILVHSSYWWPIPARYSWIFVLEFQSYSIVIIRVSYLGARTISAGWSPFQTKNGSKQITSRFSPFYGICSQTSCCQTFHFFPETNQPNHDTIFSNILHVFFWFHNHPVFPVDLGKFQNRNGTIKQIFVNSTSSCWILKLAVEQLNNCNTNFCRFFPVTFQGMGFCSFGFFGGLGIPAAFIALAEVCPSKLRGVTNAAMAFAFCCLGSPGILFTFFWRTFYILFHLDLLGQSISSKLD